jgi:hypothetical protein
MRGVVMSDLDFVMKRVGELKEFESYVHMFYGKDGVYDLGCSIPDIQNAINYYYFGMCIQADNHYEWGGGDSIDRERVRLILEDMGFAEIKEVA